MSKKRFVQSIFGIIILLVIIAVCTGVCRKYYYPHPEVGELLLDHLVHAHKGPHDHNLTDQERKVIESYIDKLQTILREDQIKNDN